MKIKGAEITAISSSPSGQVVAHVLTDDGHRFIMPFGLPVSSSDIIKGVEAYLESGQFVKTHAARLHQELTGKVPHKASKPEVLPWHSGGLWMKIRAYFRRVK